MHTLSRLTVAGMLVGLIALNGIATATEKEEQKDKAEKPTAEKTLFERNTEAIHRAEKEGKVGGDECRGKACNPNFNETDKLNKAADGNAK